ncbi:hypothetical protein GIB67_043010 [Kingdonia uniflora]|uniref:rRNA-processing protein EFG1 n=1 Tax=Kingdonia uniflora TaxID=39325 RepID=A0A7J7NTF0_9MAGN|nr:hypothetical protein GIB67_043010 [Kingdonia uniflora]
MAHGGYSNKQRRVTVNNDRPKKRLGVEKRPKSLSSTKKNQKKPKSVSLKNHIRSTERMLLRKNLPPEVKEAQEKKLEELKEQQDTQTRLALERKLFLRDRKIKFFERRKVERRIRRAEKQQRTSSDDTQEANIADQLSKLKKDLEYVRFFPKTEKYVPLFVGGDDADVVDRRNKLREQIKDNIIKAAASGKDLEETGSEDDGVLDISEDDFFLAGSSSDEADADDEWTDKSAREQASSPSGRATSGMSSDEKNQRQKSARALMPPPRPSSNLYRGANRDKTRFGCSSNKKPSVERAQSSASWNTSHSRTTSSSGKPFIERVPFHASHNGLHSGAASSSAKPFVQRAPFLSRNSSHSRASSSSRDRGSSNGTGHSSNLSSNSDAHKPRRKRRPKKKKQQVQNFDSYHVRFS